MSAPTPPPAARAVAGVWLTVYALGGSLVGVIGFGLLWNGVSHLAWGQALFGLALAVLGLDRAANALAASLLARRAGGSSGQPGAGRRGVDDRCTRAPHAGMTGGGAGERGDGGP